MYHKKPETKKKSEMEYSYELKIPKERIAVIIGKNGFVKKEIEEQTQTKITIDSEEGDILIQGRDSLKIYAVREIISAIGRGFNPEIAFLLLRPEYSFEKISMNEYAKTKKSAIRLKGRVIGENGRARKIIEELTGCNISVYGKTISIIGEAENTSIARKAIVSLLSGSPHSSTYKFLEKHRQGIRGKF